MGTDRELPMTPRASSQTLTDHKKIRRWAEERDARPACVRNTRRRGDIGMIRLDFPGYSGAGSLEEVSWDEWFQKFEDSSLALIVQNQTGRGEKSNFNKIVGRDTVEERARTGRRTSRRRRAGRSAGRRRASARGRSYQTARRAARSRSARSARKVSAVRSLKTARAKRGRSASRSRSGSRRGGARVRSISSARSTGRKHNRARTGQSRRRAA